MGKKTAFVVILLIVFIDQLIKILVKTNMYIGQEIVVFENWFLIHFTENEGMAFGLTFGGDTGKLLLSLFRILAVGFIAYFLLRFIKQKAHIAIILSFCLILGGAIGNIMDSVFYGVLFSDSFGRVAEFMPEGGGYAPALYGRVVDMFYFPIIRSTWPEWFPFWGGQSFVFFRPIFNFADAAITVGVFLILIFQRQLQP
ncbi:MAG: lipoprotein signal peptidase, partial [Chitinophagaceae bacterium]